jgi:hypothetical protein
MSWVLWDCRGCPGPEERDRGREEGKEKQRKEEREREKAGGDIQSVNSPVYKSHILTVCGFSQEGATLWGEIKKDNPPGSFNGGKHRLSLT